MNKKENFETLIKKEGYLIFPFNGVSMFPLLDDKISQVRLEVSNNYQLYDVVLFKRKDQYVLHRIIKIKNNVYYIMGDNSLVLDKVNKEDIVAKMVGYYINDKYISIKDKEYQDYLNKHIVNKNPYKKEIINPYEIEKNYEVNEEIKKAYRSLFLYSVSSSLFNVDSIKSLSKEGFKNLFLLCVYKKSDHVLYEIVKKYRLEIDKELFNKLERNADIITNRYVFQDYYKNGISQLFLEHQINHLFLKGSELKGKYQSPHLRVASDIDVYVDPKDADKAKRLIIEKYHPRDYHLYPIHHTFSLTQGRIQLELHFTFFEEELNHINNIIGDPFAYSKKDDNNPYLYHMDDKYYYLYHLAHFAKHIKEGQYWLSMLQDSYLLKDYSINNDLISRSGLETFSKVVDELLSFYLGNIKITPQIEKIEHIMYKDFLDNYVLLNKHKYQNKFIYILRRLFLTPKELNTMYPAMKGRIYLYPHYFFKRLFSRKRNKPIEELKIYNSINKDELLSIYKEIGINF